MKLLPRILLILFAGLVLAISTVDLAIRYRIFRGETFTAGQCACKGCGR
jgi:hypothetical protein